MAIFDELEENDILFIDLSHSKAEAQYHVTKIFPRLAPGTLIHHHDVVYPYQRRFDEEKIILDFYAAPNNAEFQIISGLAYVRSFDRELVNSWFHPFPGTHPEPQHLFGFER